MKKALTVICVLTLLQGCCDEEATWQEDFDRLGLTSSHSVEAPVPMEDHLRVWVEAIATGSAGDTQACWSLPQLISSAQAMSECPSGPYLLHPIVALELVSDADYDEAHPAGSSLAALLHYRAFGHENEPYQLVFQQRPVLAMQHQMTLTLTKSNGEQVIGQLDPVAWATE